MSAPMLVGLVGRKRVGKDTVAEILRISAGFERVAFADALRECAEAADPLVFTPTFGGGHARLRTVIERYGWEDAKERFPDVRGLLQRLGVGVREIDPEFWIRVAMDDARAIREAGSPVVVTDVRFPNEVRAIREAGGFVLRVARPGLASTDDHISETALDHIATDGTVFNDGSMADLGEAVGRAVAALEGI